MSVPIKMRFWCNEHGFVAAGFNERIEAVYFNQRDEVGLVCPLCFKSRPMKVELYSGVRSLDDKEIYAGDIVYLAGYGIYTAEFPFIELYEAKMENDVGNLLGNIHESPELAS